MAASTQSITTAEQLLAAGDIGRCELIRGELILMSPSGYEHVRVIATIGRILGTYVALKKLGDVLGAEGGFTIERGPDTVRAPDIAFVRTERTPRGRHVGFFDGAPDLAVEVLSPGDRASEVAEKVQQWLSAGALSVWVADPKLGTVTVFHPDQNAHVFSRKDTLQDEAVLPGFATPVAAIFE